MQLRVESDLEQIIFSKGLYNNAFFKKNDSNNTGLWEKEKTAQSSQTNRTVIYSIIICTVLGWGGKKKQTWGTRIYLFTVPYKNSLPSKPMQVYL